MHRYTFLVALLALVAPASQALTINAKALARFDAVYVVCEAKYPDMRGHREEVYLSLWQARADDKARAQLDAVRKGPIYQAEREQVRRARANGASASAVSAIEQQCQSLWSEAQRAIQAKR